MAPAVSIDRGAKILIGGEAFAKRTIVAFECLVKSKQENFCTACRMMSESMSASGNAARSILFVAFDSV